MDATARSHPQPTDPLFSVRMSDPGEIAAALPQLLGFRPRESVVLVGLSAPDGGRLGLTVRADIPPPEHAAALARTLARSIGTDRPRGVVVVVVSDEEGVGSSRDLPHRQLVWEMVQALAGVPVAVPEVLLVRRGRWWSYDCADRCCDPGTGTMLPGVSALEAAAVVTGTVVAADRAELVERIAPARGPDADAMAASCARSAVACAENLVMAGAEETAEASWTAITAALARCRPGLSGVLLTDDEVARILCGLRDVGVRDRALELALGPDAPAAEVLWTECTRRAPAPLAAAPATLLAVSAWLRGDGAMANVALDRALDGEPDYVLAGLLAQGLARCLSPAELRSIIGTALDPGARDRRDDRSAG